MAQWLAQQQSTTIVPVRAPVGPTTHQPILMTLWTSCLLLRLKFQSARGASHHPAFTGNYETISHTFYSLICLLGKRKWDCFRPDQEFGIRKIENRDKKKCGIAVGMWDESRVHAVSLILFLVLCDSRNCWASVVQWSAQQNPTAIALVRAPAGPITHQAILMTLWTFCKQPVMGEVECPAN